MADTIKLADDLMMLARTVATRLEKLEYENSEMKKASIGVLPDGTPVSDMLAALEDLKTENANLKKIMQKIKYLCDAPHWNTQRKYDIRDLASIAY